VTSLAGEMIQAFPNAAVLTDSGGSVLVFNPAAATLFPFLRDGQPLSFAIRDPEILAAVKATGGDGTSRKLEIVERLPVERAFAVSVARLASGGTLIVFDDLTPGRRLEQMRVDFVANASHELRTPLASLLGFVETLKGPARNDLSARENFLDIMEKQALRMARLVDDLLSLSRIELNAHIRPTGKVDIAAVIQQICDAMSPLAKEKSVRLLFTPPVDTSVVIGDRDELLRVFENLIENAIKYGHSGGRIDLGIAMTATGEVTAHVRDHGPGIGADDLPRLTERFYRVNVAASRDAGGTGLGLAIVKHIMARHRGRLEIESTLGDGATFRVILQSAAAEG
jgi:two-component system, OmpR family, phosphate regulon sensor histidine kinase PhoR